MLFQIFTSRQSGFFPKTALFLSGFVSRQSPDIFNVSTSLSLSIMLYVSVFYPMASSVLLKGRKILNIQI